MDLGGLGKNAASAVGLGNGGEPTGPNKFVIKGQDWYKVFGYQFAILHTNAKETEGTSGSGLFDKVKGAASKVASAFGANIPGLSDSDPKSRYYTLPIPPQVLSVNPIIASDATPTLGGVVEESSENVLWIISMQGTTGIAASREINGNALNRRAVAKRFRDTISSTGLLSGIAGQLSQSISKIGGVIDSAKSSATAFASGDIAGGIGNAVNAANSIGQPQLPYSGSAVPEESNGFTEIQELEKFFDEYNRLKHAKPKEYNLVFRMFKTNREWNCIVQGFQISKSAQSPHLWKYTLTLKCWAMRKIADNIAGSEEFDRFGSGGDLTSVNTVGIGSLNMLQTIARKGFKF